ncbi:hypothetical protein [Methanobrevibacter sp.]|uniref:hypothetical protein n=1 Tax=Methanobrevibacter sp. TaxID=66852 RepID=UPI00386E9889
MKRIFLFLILFIIILPVAADSENNFQDWQKNYYPDNTIDDDALRQRFDELTDDALDFNDFLEFDKVYQKVYWDKNSTEINEIMNQDFRNEDSNNDNELTFNEFKKGFNLILSYYQDNPSDYEFFKDTDLNDDGRITLDEFEEINYIFTEDSFWDGYSIEEICQSEFDDANSGGIDLNYTEFKRAI